MITVDNKTCVNVTSPTNNTTRSNSVTCSSVMYGQVVRLTLTKTNKTLNLCEFQIFVCKEGLYGLDCSSHCDKNCDEGCNMTSGFCTRCKEGFWGPELCHHNCSAHCAGPTCQRDDGNCEVCREGFYGPDCSSDCHQTCEGGCNKISGHCTLCREGFYGPDCSSACHQNCEGGCNKISGHCTRCKKGFWGPELCHHNCSAHCAGPTCQRDDGNCEECKPGFYGEGCSRTCGYCLNTTCHHQDGHCLAGCVSVFAEPLCLQVQVKQENWVVPVAGSLAAVLLICIGLVAIVCWCRRSRKDIEENDQRVAPPVEPESTQDRDRPSSASPISDADTTDYEIIDNNDAAEMHVQENNYESPHPYSNDDADRALYMQLSPPASDDASKVNIELS
ncbi:scavenger receptor class F member 1-like isoform X2 [Littorina saxatilis]|uniref:scavenger receptor class F member 1-like isoform X2 n=1 Tax=Littorina saxatilis TaxID=31220 RepID=UPI0038B43B21